MKSPLQIQKQICKVHEIMDYQDARFSTPGLIKYRNDFLYKLECELWLANRTHHVDVPHNLNDNVVGCPL